jgi:hypothetical protein
MYAIEKECQRASCALDETSSPNGRLGPARGAVNANAKLTEPQVLAMRKLYHEQKLSYVALAALYHIHPVTVSQIIRREIWTHLDSPPVSSRAQSPTLSLLTRNKRLSPADFMDRFVTTADPQGCWLWIALTYPSGYGRFGKVKAHRYAFELFHRPLRDGEYVLHTCDTPPCVNPTHLYAGSNVNNRHDSVARNRHAHGERSGNARLTWDLVRTIREEWRTHGTSYSQLAIMFGTSRGHINKICLGQVWEEHRDPRHAITKRNS